MSGYCYRFLDYLLNVLYIGKTKYIIQRMLQHKNNGHLTAEQYKQVFKIQYIEFPTYNDAGLCERYLISKYNPPFNTSMTNEGKITLTLDLSGYEWKDLDFNFNDCNNVRERVRNKNVINYERILKDVCMVDSTGYSFILYKMNRKPVEYLYCSKEDFEDRNDSLKDAIWLPENFLEDFINYVDCHKIPFVYGWRLSDNGWQRKLDELWSTIDKNNKTEISKFEKRAKELTAECRFVNLNKLLKHPELDSDYIDMEYRISVRDKIKHYINN